MTSLVPFSSRRNDLTARRYDRFANMIDDFFNDSMNNRLSTSNFKMDIKDQDNQYVIEAEVPGYSRDEISLDVEKGLLTISVKKEETKEEDTENYVHRERTLSSMTRRVALGEVDEDGLSAKLSDGILEIIVPKKPKLETKKTIAIE
ncbi:MAG TPA: Hsp20 family protein [Tissierellia bacterium]|nr:Hsp20 family protein [Tissierellia bacterium]